MTVYVDAMRAVETGRCRLMLHAARPALADATENHNEDARRKAEAMIERIGALRKGAQR